MQDIASAEVVAWLSVNAIDDVARPTPGILRLTPYIVGNQAKRFD